MTTATDRRNVIVAIGASFLDWSTTAFAQKPLPVVGRVSTGTREDVSGAFVQGLAKAGYHENENVAIEWRFMEGRHDRLAGILAELVDRQVAVIAVPGSAAVAIAAKEATKTIPIVFMTGADPVELKLVASLAKPGGNATGVFLLHGAVIAKRVDIFRLLVPDLTTFGLLTNPSNPAFNKAERKAFEDAARSMGLELVVAGASNQDEIDASFSKLVAPGARAVAVGADALFFLQRGQIAALGSRYAIPSVGGWSEYATAGGLMSYATSNDEALALTGYIVGRLLSGEKPSEMPVQQVTKFELVINLSTAKALGLIIPDKLLALADKVIE